MWPFSTSGAGELMYMEDNLKIAKQLMESTDRVLAAAAAHAFFACKNVCESYCNAPHKECWSTSGDLIAVARSLHRTLQELANTSALGRAQNNTCPAPRPTAQSLRAKADELLEARDRAAELVLPSRLPLHRLASHTVTKTSGILSTTTVTSATFYEETLPAYDAGMLVKFKDGRVGKGV